MLQGQGRRGVSKLLSMMLDILGMERRQDSFLIPSRSSLSSRSRTLFFLVVLDKLQRKDVCLRPGNEVLVKGYRLLAIRC